MEQTSEDPTLVDRRPSNRAEPGTSIAPPLSSTSTNPPSGTGPSLTTALAIDEEHSVRGRAIARIGVVIGIMSAIALQVPARSAPLRLAATVGSLGVAAGGAAILLISRKRRVVHPNHVFVLGIFATLAILVLLAHCGVFSAPVLALCLGIYYFGLGDSAFQGWILFILAAAGYALLAALSIGNVLPVDQAVFALRQNDAVSLTAVTVVLEVMLMLTFWLARLSRRATIGAISRLEAAHRQIHQRDALLDEARADLHGALGAGRRGRFTGREVGPYMVDELIGRGAMGEVYAAHKSAGGESIALKVLNPYSLGEPAHIRRFLREGMIAGALDSPHIVRILETGYADDGSPFLAMERLHGKDLAWYLRENRRLDLPTVIELVSQVSAALAVAQDAGIVHRDLKPQNLFLSEKDGQKRWKVLDFGVSQINQGAGTLTHGEAVGTPSYMSPEQVRGEAVDHRSDVFALAVIAYRALTGRPPFTAHNAMASMYNVCHVQPLRPGELVPRVNVDVDMAFALALAKDREGRFTSALTFAAAVRDAARGELDSRWRAAAFELLEEHPWGTDDADRLVRSRA